jgi:hypothetical protein
MSFQIIIVVDPTVCTVLESSLTVSPRVRVSFPLGSIPVAGRGNTPPREISPRGGNLFPPGEHFEESYCTVRSLGDTCYTYAYR